MAGQQDLRELHWAGVGMVVLSWLATGCHVPISQEVLYKPEIKARHVARAEKRNDLRAGLRRLVLRGPDGQALEAEAGDARELGRRVAEALGDTLVFKELVYPLRDEKVDVVLEPVMTVTLTKNRTTNALKVLGLFLPYIDGLGFDYDYTAKLDLLIRNPKRKGVLCDRFSGSTEMTAERYPSILWFLGIHVGMIILMVFESVTTDQAVLDRLIDQATDRALVPVQTRLREEFSPTGKPCALHPKEEQPGRYCIIGGRDLYYPVLFRGGDPPK